MSQCYIKCGKKQADKTHLPVELGPGSLWKRFVWLNTWAVLSVQSAWGTRQPCHTRRSPSPVTISHFLNTAMSFYLQAKLYVNQIYFLCHDLIYPSLQKNVHYLKVGGGTYFHSRSLYLPTDAQDSCFKRTLQFTLKQLLHVSVQSPSSGSILFELAKVTVVKIIC